MDAAQLTVLTSDLAGTAIACQRPQQISTPLHQIGAVAERFHIIRIARQDAVEQLLGIGQAIQRHQRLCFQALRFQPAWMHAQQLIALAQRLTGPTSIDLVFRQG